MHMLLHLVPCGFWEGSPGPKLAGQHFNKPSPSLHIFESPMDLLVSSCHQREGDEQALVSEQVSEDSHTNSLLEPTLAGRILISEGSGLAVSGASDPRRVHVIAEHHLCSGCLLTTDVQIQQH